MSKITDYIQTLSDSERIGPMLVHHELLPEQKAVHRDPARPLPQVLQGMLGAYGVGQLFSHQALAIDAARSGQDVVVATPTASGKTLCYNLPVFEQIFSLPDSRALYLFPLKALARDQLGTIRKLATLAPSQQRIEAAVYDGDTSPYQRKKLRDEPPDILLTNPEMLHLSILPYHSTWSAFLANLTHVVVDEVHTYRGVMGSHMALVFRRLKRICRYYGADPAFIHCSATVANPAELAHSLTSRKPVPVLESGAPQGARHFVFANPMGSPASTAIRMLQTALEKGLRTIVYAQSRRMVELIGMWAAEKAGPFKNKISAYRSGFLPEERREIEARMASGDLLAVVSTSALELGIDIGGLDVCILCGYPGSVMQTLQRGGRVGRKQQDSAVVLVAGEDALDQYFMRHPTDFFQRPPESAVVNPYNPVILARHLDCAAAELSLRKGEEFLAEEGIQREVDNMLAKGVLLESADGLEIFSQRKRPHRMVNLRGTGSTFSIEDADGTIIGQLDDTRAIKEAHPGAVYLHLGRTYVVQDLDMGTRTVKVVQTRVGYYTKVRAEKDTEILERLDSRVVWGTRVHLGRLRVTERVIGYEKRRTGDGRMLNMTPLELEPLVFETEGLWFDIPDTVRRQTEDAMHHFMGGIHAVEHAAIGILPLLVMTDRNDLGGISTPMHPQAGGSAVFIYDGHPGGVGLSRLAFSKADDLLERTLATIESCPCELGCPSCVHSPKCGSGNRPISKDAAIFVLKAIRDGEPPKLEATEETIQSVPTANMENIPAMHPDEQPTEFPALAIEQPDMQSGKTPSADAPLPNAKSDNTPSDAGSPNTSAIRYMVMDVETRRSAKEVGGWNRADRMGVSVAVLYDSAGDEYIDYEQDRIPEMVERMAQADMVIGFNISRFDYAVLSGLYTYDYQRLPTLDLLTSIYHRLSYRLPLDNLGKATLDAPKTADGLQALAWWKEGKLDEIAHYCRADVRITRDLYLYGRDNGHVLFTNKAKRVVRLPVDWTYPAALSNSASSFSKSRS
ncbi:MAG: DEAD/DEAH box helicase [Desulfovibrio sp.]|uniref:DEAD/DEAH box helicase n=1 Tax=Desulfovibrio sp. 7SRBS1 TaxID=3378064 RepID=UPI003B4070EC